jgi:hypothetical protein
LLVSDQQGQLDKEYFLNDLDRKQLPDTIIKPYAKGGAGRFYPL